MRILVTGGAGFVGGNICVALAHRHPDWELIAFDNLSRRGSELNLPRLRDAGIRFVHGDVRDQHDLLAVGEVDALIEASAEPSVLAGLQDGVEYLVRTNLVGAFHSLELCRRHGAQLVFLSTSRVYPVAALRQLSYSESPSRFELDGEQSLPGASARGIGESFPLDGPRTLYGATKLAAELLIVEYAETFGVRAAVNRCGVVAGPWQMGRVDQGVFAYWMLAHRLGMPLSYLGFAGSGKQVRDLLHVDDLVELLVEQITEPERWIGTVFNVGGGRECSLSLVELTDLCREISGRRVDIAHEPEGRPGDVPIYVSDCSALFAHTRWRPRRLPHSILEDISAWVASDELALGRALGLT
jgi:CDP-paratose 2-epimerase